MLKIPNPAKHRFVYEVCVVIGWGSDSLKYTKVDTEAANHPIHSEFAAGFPWIFRKKGWQKTILG